MGKTEESTKPMDRRDSEIELAQLKSHFNESHDRSAAELQKMQENFEKARAEGMSQNAAEIAALKAHFRDTHEETKGHTAAEIAAAKGAIAASSDSLRQAVVGSSESSRAHTAQEMAILKEEILAGHATSTEAFKAHTTMELSALQDELKLLKDLVGNLTNSVAAGFEKHTLILNDVKESNLAAEKELNRVQPTMHQMLDGVKSAIETQEHTSEKMAKDLKNIEDAAIDSMKAQQVELHRDMSDTMAKQQLVLRKDISKWSNSVVKQQHVVTENMKAQQVSLHNDMIKIMSQNQASLHSDLTESLSEQQKEVAESMVKHQTYLHDEMAAQADRQHADMAASILNQEKMADKISERLDYIQWVKDEDGPGYEPAKPTSPKSK